jgi:excisionase family DNA binding protein
MNTFNLKEAAAFLKMHAETLRKRVKAGKFPAAKFGKSYVFLEEDLAAAVRCKYSLTSISVITQQKGISLWPFLGADKSGGLTSRYTAESELDNLLKQRTRRSRNNATTN